MILLFVFLIIIFVLFILSLYSVMFVSGRESRREEQFGEDMEENDRKNKF